MVESVAGTVAIVVEDRIEKYEWIGKVEVCRILEEVAGTRVIAASLVS